MSAGEHRYLQTRRRALQSAAGLLLGLSGCASDPTSRELVVYKTPYCGCCRGWVTHMSRAGFRPQVREVEDLNPVRERHGVPFPLSACHTALIGGYVVEGHVPAEDVIRLLKEKPEAIGLTVPGMPVGSPGMESPSGETEAYQTLLLLNRGQTRPFASHG